MNAAAFGRLCVETAILVLIIIVFVQPPSGGCVLKHASPLCKIHLWLQPPSGGCVLKLCARSQIRAQY